MKALWISEIMPSVEDVLTVSPKIRLTEENKPSTAHRRPYWCICFQARYPFFLNSRTAFDLGEGSSPTTAFSLIFIPGQSTPFSAIRLKASFVSYAPSIRPYQCLFNKGRNSSLSAVSSSVTSIDRSFFDSTSTAKCTFSQPLRVVPCFSRIQSPLFVTFMPVESTATTASFLELLFVELTLRFVEITSYNLQIAILVHTWKSFRWILLSDDMAFAKRNR